MSGWIRLYRGWHDNELFSNDAFCERAAWAWLLSNAAWKDTRRVGPQGDLVEVKEGEFHTSLRSLAKAWNWDKNKVSRFLKRATMCGNIGTSAGQGGMHITICNWGKYQGERDKLEPASGTRTGQARDTQEEGIRKKEEKNNIIPAKNKFELPDWIDPEVWSGFVDMRKAKKKPLTDRALSNLITKLDKMREDGEDPNAVLDRSIDNSWTGIWPVKGETQGEVVVGI